MTKPQFTGDEMKEAYADGRQAQFELMRAGNCDCYFGSCTYDAPDFKPCPTDYKKCPLKKEDKDE